MDEAVEAALVQAGAQINALQASERRLIDELAALRKDAERYRWLRNNPQWLGWEHDFRPDEVEREIDAAMRAAPAVGAA